MLAFILLYKKTIMTEKPIKALFAMQCFEVLVNTPVLGKLAKAICHNSVIPIYGKNDR